MKITHTDRLGNKLSEASGENSVEIEILGEFGFEDILIFEMEPGSFVEVDIDPTFNKSIVYAPDGKIVYQLPVGPKARAYDPEAFKGERHLITMERVSRELLAKRRNLAMNSLDTRWDTGYFPHASANVVTRDEPWFEAKNAIDGHLSRVGHGAWPYQSWGGGLRDDLVFRLDFGREVLIDEIVIYLRADYADDHDINWESGVVTFSDGEKMPISMKKVEEGQSYAFAEKKVTWIELSELKREISAAFSALTQIEVFGRDIL
ncbi:hypothetical protein QEH56_10700 [Pelagicoccus enzymogenes]|uniref:hypothetical protein n=1 Tax=Pelagicoccus enzymogenes TaxID=2773457 RepID=UPI00280CFC34|nr:hypothetical protein [Pelagicoccus enzymogenes]MDQ8198621.1 hypothetical protein [Pelagicoccus enzymogenes]